MKRVLLSCVLVGLVLGATGCPPVIVPPFTATGIFVGTWVPPVDVEKGEGCPITLDIVHNVDESFPRNLGIEAIVTLDLSCHPDVQALTDAGLNTTLVLEMKGALDTRGQFILATPPCEDEICIGSLFGGEGFDDNDDGLMDRATGSIGLTIDDTEMEIFVLDADFEVNRQ
jgi:hypothetical protein